MIRIHFFRRFERPKGCDATLAPFASVDPFIMGNIEREKAYATPKLIP